MVTVGDVRREDPGNIYNLLADGTAVARCYCNQRQNELSLRATNRIEVTSPARGNQVVNYLTTNAVLK